MFSNVKIIVVNQCTLKDINCSMAIALEVHVHVSEWLVKSKVSCSMDTSCWNLQSLYG